MTDRPTGDYTADRLRQLEDSHKAMSMLLLAYMTRMKPHDDVVWDAIHKAGKILREAGLK